jgi:ANTAR domain
MEIEQAAGVLAALRRCTTNEAFDEILSVSKRHRVPALRVARALIALAEQTDEHDHHAIAAARYEWGSLMEPTAVAQ